MNTSKLRHSVLSSNFCATTSLFENSRNKQYMILRLFACLLLFFAVAVESPRAQLFGDGSDGDSTITGSVSLSSDMNFNNLDISPGAVLTTNGFDVRVNGTLTISFGTL